MTQIAIRLTLSVTQILVNSKAGFSCKSHNIFLQKQVRISALLGCDIKISGIIHWTYQRDCMCDRTTVLSGLDLAYSSLFKEERTEACVVSARKEHFSLFRPSIASKSLRYLALRNEQGCTELTNLITRCARQFTARVNQLRSPEFDRAFWYLCVGLSRVLSILTMRCVIYSPFDHIQRGSMLKSAALIMMKSSTAASPCLLRGSLV